jgi:hypothetical protein
MSASNDSSPNWRFAGRVLLKAAALFVALNALFSAANPLSAIGRLSAYNVIFPGRHRLPFGENSAEAYNLSLFQLDAMFASHEVAAPKPPDEYRVLLIGDSSVWGILLTPEETLVGHINAADLTTADGKPVRAYNLGYPTISVTKDLMMLSRAMQYEPDMVVWLATLEDVNDTNFVDASFWDRTIVGQRRALADVLRLNLYGALWAATGVDQFYPESYEPRMEDLPPDETFHGLQPPHLSEDDLALDVLAAGAQMVGDVPLLIVNEPMFVSQGENSDIRYNFFYPRWAYDDYRVMLAQQAEANGWRYLDLWDAVPNTEYTNSAIHLTPEGSAQLAALIGEAIIEP